MIASSSTFRVNAVIFIESLRDSDAKTGRWVEEDLAAEFDAMRLLHEYHPVTSKAEFMALLENIRARATMGLRPILQFDTHGHDDCTGMLIAPTGELVTWHELASALREINRATANHLNVVLACCYGFHGISAVSLGDVTPFLHLVGPEDVEAAGTFRDRLPHFYRALFGSGTIESALAQLPSKFRMYYAEKLLTISFIKYLIVGTRGDGRAARIERLLSELTARHPHVDVNAARKKLRELVKPENADFDSFKRRFLLAEHPDNAGRFGITLDDCLSELDQLSPETISAIRANAR